MYNLETEEALLFCILNKPECIEDIRRWVPEGDVFYNSFNKQVWLECYKLYNNNEPVDALSVSRALPKNKLDGKLPSYELTRIATSGA